MSMPEAQALLLRQQAAAAKACDRMLHALIDYTPCAKLAIEDVKFISEWCRTVAFDAIKEVEA